MNTCVKFEKHRTYSSGFHLENQVRTNTSKVIYIKQTHTEVSYS